ncbi:hypothetical protein M9Y10_039853 [Tritrichomonas musculus]|uniref:DUF3447 domain-containing protein n=1 Tax=Tritrichomonas musculus TaxID=1915356 RepID=A0ABR2GRC7_9EUKA
MEFQQYLSEKKKLQDVFLGYLDDNENVEEHFENLLKICDDQNIKNDSNEFGLFIHFVFNIADNHFRTKDFFFKIEKILLIFKDIFQNSLSDDIILSISRSNKRIILFLFENKFIDIKSFKKIIYLDKQYFSSEINELIQVEEVQDDPNFDENRKKGENQSPLACFIRNDSISDFITYIKRNEISLKATIETSIYETNQFLIDSTPTLIEYSAFFGSIQVFTYLFKNKVELTPSLWLYAVHGRNPEIFKILEDEKVVPEDETYEKCLIEALQCHHNDVIHYIKSNFISKENQIHIDELLETESIDCYNFSFFPDDNLFNKNNFYKFCEYDYYFFADQYLANHQIDINFEICEMLGEETYINTPLTVAIDSYFDNIVKLLLKQPGIDVNYISTGYNWERSYIETWTPLNMAVPQCTFGMVQILFNHKNIDVNAFKTIKEVTENYTQIIEHPILYDVLLYGDLQMLELFLSHPNINVNLKTSERIYSINDQDKIISSTERSLLYIAIENNQFNKVKALLQHPKIDVNLTSFKKKDDIEENETPLAKAIQIGNHEIIKILLEHSEIDTNKIIQSKNSKYNAQNTILTFAIESKVDIDIINLLLSYRNIDVNMPMEFESDSKKRILTPLSLAIMHNLKEVIESLLSCQRIDINAKYIIMKKSDYYSETYHLFGAIDKKMYDIVMLLLNHPKIDVNVHFYEKKYNCSKIEKVAFLHRAIIVGNIEIIRAILSNPNADINIKSFSQNISNNMITKREQPAICEAINSKKIDIVRLFLLKPGLDINSKLITKVIQQTKFYVEEKTLLQFAVIVADLEIIRFLLVYLRKKGKLNDIKEIMNETNDANLKAILYEYINKQS